MRKQKPSATAILIAASLGFCGEDVQLSALVNPMAARSSRDFMDAYGTPASLFRNVLFKRWFKPIAYAVERATIPGMMLHYIVRKRYLAETAQQYLSQGIQQVVILGAGFDVLAASLYLQFPGTTFLELDFPATQAAKQEALVSQKLGENMVFVPIDFTRQTLEESLLNHPRYSPGKNTLFIAEGVLMYLSQPDVDRLFGFIRKHAGPESVFAFTFMEPRANGKVNFHNRSKAVDLWMAIRGEPFTWGILREELADYLSSVGFSLEGLATPAVFRERYLKSATLTRAPLAEGEYVSVARRLK